MTIVCAGEILFDDIETMRGSTVSSVVEEAPSVDEASFVSERIRRVGGAPANVAVGIRRYGVASAFIGGISTDAAGDACVRALTDAGVGVEVVQRIAGAPTRFVHVRQDTRGEREFVDFFGLDAGVFADAQLAAEELPDQVLRDARMLVSGTLGFAYPKSRAALERLFDAARDAEAPIFIDVNRRPMFWPSDVRHQEFEYTRRIVDRARYLKLEAAEAQWLFATVDPAAIIDAHPHLAGVLLTNGPREMYYRFHGTGGVYRPPTVQAIDATGAGDACVAGFLAYWARVGFDPAQVDMAVGYGAAAGALATLTIGAQDALPDAARVEAASGFILP